MVGLESEEAVFARYRASRQRERDDLRDDRAFEPAPSRRAA